MTPAARLAAVIDILEDYAPTAGRPIDGVLSAWGRANRYAGSKDRAAIADRIYDCLRRWRSYGAWAGDDARGRVLASLRAEGVGLEQISALFDGGPRSPAALTAAERAMLSAAAEEDDRAAGRADWPAWLWDELAASVVDPGAMAARSRRRAPIDLRVNRLKSTRAEAAAALASGGVATLPAPLSPDALRLAHPQRITGMQVFQDGWVELQDAASQAVALLAAALAEPWGRDCAALDYCAGAGGKALALAAAFGGVGRVAAQDRDARRLRDLPARAARAGARIEVVTGRPAASLGASFDLVLVDAPCSGSGSWGRRPEEKLRLTPDRLAAIGEDQRRALAGAAQTVRPGGWLVYATCSVLMRENLAQSSAFLRDHDAFEPASLEAAWARAGLEGRPSEARPPGASTARFAPEACALFTPPRWDVDGFFVAAFRRRLH